MENGIPNGRDKQYTYEDIEEIAKYLQKRISIVPKIGIICGSGLGSIAELIEDSQTFDYKNIPKFPLSTVQSHAGKLTFGTIADVPVVCMQGRFHFYEGYPLWKCVMPVRLMKILGVSHFIASNAAGGLNPSLREGDIMLIKDHVNLMGFAGIGPLVGYNDSRFGPRFLAMNNAYDLDILEKVKSLAKNLGLQDIIKEGVYTCVGGPHFETVAELKAMERLGIDAVGMSTVHEVTVARHCGMVTFAFSLITNMCVTEYGSSQEPNSDEILEIARKRQEDLKRLMLNIIQIILKDKIANK